MTASWFGTVYFTKRKNKELFIQLHKNVESLLWKALCHFYKTIFTVTGQTEETLQGLVHSILKELFQAVSMHCVPQVPLESNGSCTANKLYPCLYTDKSTTEPCPYCAGILVLTKDMTAAIHSSPLKQFVCRYEDLPSGSSSFKICQFSERISSL